MVNICNLSTRKYFGLMKNPRETSQRGERVRETHVMDDGNVRFTVADAAPGRCVYQDQEPTSACFV